MPPQRPADAHLTAQHQSEMHGWFKDGPQDLGAHTQLAWEGKPTQAPTATRPPTQVEASVLRNAAHQIRNSDANGGYPQSVRLGEHAGTTDYRVRGQGQVEVRPVSSNYAAGGSVNHAVPQGSNPPIFWHSHPTRPDTDALLGRPETANVMPSRGDHKIAGDHYASHGAKNYQIWGDQVHVYDGKSQNVTKLDPSPVQGILDPAPTPHPSTRPTAAQAPADQEGPSSWAPWNNAPAGPGRSSPGRPPSSGSSDGLFQGGLVRNPAPAPPTASPGAASSSSSDGLFQKPIR